jgi:hypothetical protein
MPVRNTNRTSTTRKSSRARAAKDQKITRPSPAALAAKRASAGIGIDDGSVWDDWFLQTPQQASRAA